MQAVEALMSWHAKKGPYGFLVCCFSTAHVQSPIWATDTAVYLKKDVQEELQSQNMGT